MFGDEKFIQKSVVEKIMVCFRDATWVTLCEEIIEETEEMMFRYDTPKKEFGEHLDCVIDQIITDQNDYFRYYCLVKEMHNGQIKSKRLFIITDKFEEDTAIKLNRKL